MRKRGWRWPAAGGERGDLFPEGVEGTESGIGEEMTSCSLPLESLAAGDASRDTKMYSWPRRSTFALRWPLQSHIEANTVTAGYCSRPLRGRSSAGSAGLLSCSLAAPRSQCSHSSYRRAFSFGRGDPWRKPGSERRPGARAWLWPIRLGERGSDMCEYCALPLFE